MQEAVKLSHFKLLKRHNDVFLLNSYSTLTVGNKTYQSNNVEVISVLSKRKCNKLYCNTPYWRR